ncbi:deleted in malignant brain tumors 1 protein-like [Engraulis encrasicolus]|uniref:deleted in malignant brain tumors 1 protein-like n=1 Tax=Engraulis encrasicolus TaxID=184585 RepID=UPI002FD4C950
MGIRTASFILFSLLGVTITHGEPLQCGGVFTESEGEFFSPDYPAPYPNHANCTWTIQSTGNRIIELTFPFMEVEHKNWDADCTFDSISVYDGSMSDNRLLAKVCGDEPRSFNSTRNELTVHFSSDATFPEKGFHAKWSFTDVPSLSEYPVVDKVTPGVEPTDIECGGDLTEAEGKFSSPNYPKRYPNSANCTWSIRSTGNRIIALTIPTLRLEADWLPAQCRFDSVSVYDGPASDKRLLGRLCGTQTGNYKSTRNELTVVFSSDSSTTQKGFTAEYSFIDVPSLSEYPAIVPTEAPTESVTEDIDPIDIKCGGELAETEGNFFSPNYPKYYPNKAKCTWSIKSTGNSIIALTIPTLRLEADWLPDCRFDSVSVYDGPASDKRLLGRLCGTQTGTFNSTRNELTVVFSSDSSGTFTGFKAEYSFIDVPSLSEYPPIAPKKDPTGTNCGGLLVEPKGEFFSPNYTAAGYPKNARCTWTIQSPGDKAIELNFPFMEVESRHWDPKCSFDSISVYDGPLENDHLLARLCDNQNPSVKSTTNEMTVIFVSDSSISRKGFHAEYSFIDMA